MFTESGTRVGLCSPLYSPLLLDKTGTGLRQTLPTLVSRRNNIRCPKWGVPVGHSHLRLATLAVSRRNNIRCPKGLTVSHIHLHLATFAVSRLNNIRYPKGFGS